MRIMAIDYGTKRIGVAISDPSCTMAHPMETIIVKPDGSHMNTFLKIIKDYQITKIVVGLPYNMDGSVGESGKRVIDWCSRLEDMVSVPVILWDERLTTSEAHEILMDLNVKGRKKRDIVDKIAASIILRDYLSTLNT